MCHQIHHLIAYCHSWADLIQTGNPVCNNKDKKIRDIDNNQPFYIRGGQLTLQLVKQFLKKIRQKFQFYSSGTILLQNSYLDCS